MNNITSIFLEEESRKKQIEQINDDYRKIEKYLKLNSDWLSSASKYSVLDKYRDPIHEFSSKYPEFDNFFRPLYEKLCNKMRYYNSEKTIEDFIIILIKNLADNETDKEICSSIRQLYLDALYCAKDIKRKKIQEINDNFLLK